jgi:hypothetical protein
LCLYFTARGRFLFKLLLHTPENVDLCKHAVIRWWCGALIINASGYKQWIQVEPKEPIKKDEVRKMMEQTKKESLLERYWRLRGEADELYQRRMRQIKINEEMRKSIQRELDALEDA